MTQRISCGNTHYLFHATPGTLVKYVPLTLASQKEIFMDQDRINLSAYTAAFRKYRAVSRQYLDATSPCAITYDVSTFLI
jgi:hypothetical protein